MNRREMVEVETSVPVQGRVSLLVLAEMAQYFGKIGVHIPTMSSLLSFSVGIAAHMLRQMGESSQIDSPTEAHQLLSSMNLYQRTMWKRSREKVMNAIRFENLREEGVDPQSYVPQHYNMVHNSRSVNVLGSHVPAGMGGSRMHDVEDSKDSKWIDDATRDKAIALYMKEEEIEEGRRIAEREKEKQKAYEYIRANVGPDGLMPVYTSPGNWRKNVSDGPSTDGPSSEPVVECLPPAKVLVDSTSAKKLKGKSKKDDDRPRKLTDEELDAKGEEIKERDRVEKLKMDQVTREMMAKKGLNPDGSPRTCGSQMIDIPGK